MVAVEVGFHKVAEFPQKHLLTKKSLFAGKLEPLRDL